jgi:DNA-binding SARP family transcriptional activator
MHVHVATASRSPERQPGEPVVICLLGSFRVLGAGQPIRLRGGSKAEALLSSLAVRGKHGQTREQLLDSLWPDSEPNLAGQSLNSLVYSLHRLLGSHLDDQPPVQYSGGWYRLNRAAGVAVDVHLFEQSADSADKYIAGGQPEQAAATYQHAVDLYRGDLCAGADVHGLVERERLRARFLNVLAHLADFHFSTADYDACLDAVLRLLAADPCREDAHRLAMRSYLRRGERAQALRQYRLCEAILATEFETVPEPATRALFERIRTEPDGV